MVLHAWLSAWVGGWVGDEAQPLTELQGHCIYLQFCNASGLAGSDVGVVCGFFGVVAGGAVSEQPLGGRPVQGSGGVCVVLC